MASSNAHLPKKAKRVFKGVIFDVWQWKQIMFDGSVELFEHLSRPDSVNVVATVGDTILIQRQKQSGRHGFFSSIPGGRVDAGETALRAAKRELLEETGYASKDWALFLKVDPNPKIIWTAYTFLARDCIKVGAPSLDAGERITTRHVPFDTFLKLADDPSFRDWDLKFELLRAQYDKTFRQQLFALLFQHKT